MGAGCLTRTRSLLEGARLQLDEEVGESVTKAVSTRPELLIIDLTGVQFLGSAGIDVLVRAHHLAGSRTAVRVVAAERATLLPLRITGLDTTMAIFPTVEQALAEDAGGEEAASHC